MNTARVATRGDTIGEALKFVHYGIRRNAAV
jgi:hypothetical protein